MIETLWEELFPHAPIDIIFEACLTLPGALFFDSSLNHPHLGRYSYVCADPFLWVRTKDGVVEVSPAGDRAGLLDRAGHPAAVVRAGQPEVGDRVEGESDPFRMLQELLRRFATTKIPGLPPFQGGAAGYFGYDLGRYLEKLPSRAVDDAGLPDMVLGFYRWVIAQDHCSGRTYLFVNAVDGDVAAAERTLDELRMRVARVGADGNGIRGDRRSNWKRGRELTGNFSKEGYLRAIESAKEYIAAGDIYEVCLSQRFAVKNELSPWQLYRRLRSVSPAPYGAYLAFPEAAVLSASPELFLRVEDGVVETRPIKGTRPRGGSPEEDARLHRELAASEKDRAENLMIVDLLRNDLGRVCDIGSVAVPELFKIESYRTVHHMVSAVRGRLRAGLDAVDLLRASFPGGSVTGCPKIRAMEIIDELEPTRRGAYCGAAGWLGFSGDMDTNIVIRTMVVKDGIAYCQVGGAIVADSDPEAEYQETLDKARAAMLAWGMEDGAGEGGWRQRVASG